MDHPGQHQTTRVFACPQCPKIFATRSNLKRHMENPNIHNIPYIRNRDQKRWKGHTKKVVSKEETTERMRKWRAENREKNRQNDLRCRVYRLARQRFGEHDSPEKQQFVRDEITRRLGRRMMLEQQKDYKQHCHRSSTSTPQSQSQPLSQQQQQPQQQQQLQQQHHHDTTSREASFLDLPFYSAPQQKIELPSIVPRLAAHSSAASSPALPHLSPSWRVERRTSSSSNSSNSSVSSLTSNASNTVDSSKSLSPISTDEEDAYFLGLPPMHTLLYPSEIKYVEQTRILDEFVGVVLNYASHQS